MNLISLKKLTLNNFGPFVGTHVVEFPTSGLCLIKGRVIETGDGSGSGKSYLLKAISHLFGGCPDPATEIQSWFSEDPPEVSAIIKTPNGEITVKRRKGLVISGASYKEILKGKSAEPELDKIFGIDERSRAIITYRGQRQPGLFLSLNDEKKKSFLWGLLDLSPYEKVAKEAQDKAGKLGEEVASLTQQVNFIYSNLETAKISLQSAEKELEEAPTKEFDATSCKKRILEIKTNIKNLQSDVENLRKASQNELEAVLGTIKSKSKLVYQKQEPIEVTALRSELERQRKQLESSKDKDAALRLEAEKKRNELRLIIQTNQKDISRNPKLSADLDSAKKRESLLIEQKCSECKREWIGTEAEKTLVTVREFIESANFQLEAIGAMEESVKEKTLQLQRIKDPEVSPLTKESQYKVVSIDADIKTKIEAFESKKRQAINLLDQEEKTTKKQFQDKLTLDLQEFCKEEQSLQSELERDLKAEKDFLESQAQIKAKHAIVEERRSQVANTEVSYKDILSRKLEVEKAWNLEKDIVALVGRSGFLGTIIEEVLNEISSVANDILSQIANVRHLSLDFETEKVSKTTDNTQAKITPIVYSRGRRVSLTSGISGGMQVAVELSVDLAVGEVISRRRGTYPGWIVLDESFDGLGNIAKEAVLEMLKNHAGDRLVLVVDHDSTFQGLFDTVINVEMSDGKSSIVV